VPHWWMVTPEELAARYQWDADALMDDLDPASFDEAQAELALAAIERCGQRSCDDLDGFITRRAEANPEFPSMVDAALRARRLFNEKEPGMGDPADENQADSLGGAR